MITRRNFLAAASSVAVAAPFLLRAARLPELRLGLATDAQFADQAPQQTRFYRQSIAKLTEAVEHFNSLDLDGCLHLGDLINQRWESYDAVLSPLAKSRHRFHYLLGNHDFDVADELKPQVPRRLGLKRRFYSVRQPGFCLVMLDTTDVSPYAHREAAKERADATAECQRLADTGASNAHPWNGAVSRRQLEWFDDTCRQAAQTGRKVIVFSHHPVFPDGPLTEWNAEALLKVVAQNRNVVAWFNGHDHAGAFGLRDDVPFITLKGMVETADTNAFAMLTLRPDRLELVGHGREVSRELQFRKP